MHLKGSQVMADKIVTVFGGTGFLGRRVVRDLHGQNVSVRVASRHPQQASIASPDTTLNPIFADIHDEHSVAHAVAGAVGVVNAVSLYVERGAETFDEVHVAAADVRRRAQALSVPSIFQGLALMLRLAPFIYASEAKGN
jgi:NADH dehydrogenase